MSSDPANCGSCNYKCSLPHANVSCNQGSCAVDSCQSGYAYCNNNCNTQESATQCGASCTDCTKVYPNGQVSCQQGVCQLTSCNAGYAHCGNACTPNSASQCGASCADCTFDQASCTRGACIGGQCNYTDPTQTHPVVCMPKECNTSMCFANGSCSYTLTPKVPCGKTGSCYSQGMCVPDPANSTQGVCNGKPLPATTACNTNDPCKQNGQCDGNGACNESPKVDGTPCPAPSGCSTSGMCVSGSCSCSKQAPPDMSAPGLDGGATGSADGGSKGKSKSGGCQLARSTPAEVALAWLALALLVVSRRRRARGE